MRTLRHLGLAAVVSLALTSAPLRAQETVILGAVGSASANGWPTYIGIEKGFFAAEGLKADVVFAQSNAAVNQQLTAGSTNFAINTGLVDPLRAIDKGAPLAIVRIEIQSPPYALLAKSSIKSMKELKGKTLSVGGAKDITRLFVDRMLASAGLKSGEYDYVYAGATSARFAALQAGAVDAAILTAPFNFHAESSGFVNVGNTVDIVDVPFAGTVVNKTWAAANRRTVEKVLAVYDKSIAWLYDPKNREEAIQILLKVSRLKREDVEKSYDYLLQGKYFEPTGRVSRKKLGELVAALKSLGDLEGAAEVDRFVLAGVTQMSD
jgi:ABC-type nitrate/sulfonate/bicarbonate transport system substrate-binding protein